MKEDLNRIFGIDNHISFSTGKAGFPLAVIKNNLCYAEITTHGAHVMKYQPNGEKEVLWMSEHGYWADLKPIRGGIPVCWPWFGPKEGLPSHGFARILKWDVVSTAALPDGSTELVMELADSEATRQYWRGQFKAKMTVVAGKSLIVSLSIQNADIHPVTYTGALHTYFTISDINTIEIAGLDGVSYIDTLTGDKHVQKGHIKFNAETDRIYLDTLATCRVLDPGLQRVINVAKTGSRSTVVWNPWIAKAKRLEDFGDNEYPGMLCVEAANNATDVITLKPGETHVTGTTVSVEAI